ncbi:MAG: DUF1080 domain-containing protein, partial [Calditrichaeota bacterium]|nr:DUF1080 domain-containing protein [Calditrichota bacterium]
SILNFLSPDTKSVKIRRAALKALAKYQRPDLIKFFLKELKLFPQNADLVLDALRRFPNSAFENKIEKHYFEWSDSARLAVIPFAAERDLKLLTAALLKETEGANPALRRQAWKGLAKLADKEQIEPMLALALKSGGEKEQQQALKAVAEAARRTKSERLLKKQLQTVYPSAADSQKIAILKLCKKMGGKAYFELVEKGLNSASPAVKNQAREILLKWQDDAALPALLEFARKNRNNKKSVLAVRQSVRIIRQSGMAAERAFLYLQKLMPLAKDVSEKQMIISALGQFPAYPAVRYLSSLLDHPELSDAAFNALSQIVSQRKDDSDLSPKEIYLATLEGRASEAVRQMIEQQRNLNKPPEGFEALFNGKDLSGWQAVAYSPPQKRALPESKLDSLQKAADREAKKHWLVSDGVLMFDGDGYLGLQTKREFKNFELLADWKIEKFGDSGIYLRGCPQVQIWDPAQWKVGSGGLYNNQKNPRNPLKTADKPTGRWNRFRIIMRGERVTVYLNDVLVTDNVILENYWERDKPVYEQGPVELQAHNSPLYFRNIFIRELPDEPPLFKGPLFNGKNLEGWKVIGGKPESWRVKDGILYTSGKGGGWISTVKEFGDFKLSLEFRVPAGGNSGVFIRAPHSGDPAYTGMEIQVLDDYAPVYANLKPWQYTGSIYGVQA